MMAGFDHARGRVVVSLDGDLQNDPRDIPMLVAKLDEGYDLVCGWRQRRQDKLILRKVPSWVANRIIRRLTGVQITDNGCSLKAYRRDLLTGSRSMRSSTGSFPHSRPVSARASRRCRSATTRGDSARASTASAGR